MTRDRKKFRAFTALETTGFPQLKLLQKRHTGRNPACTAVYARSADSRFELRGRLARRRMQSLPAQACRSMQAIRTRIALIATERGFPKSESAEATGLRHDDLLEWNRQDAGLRSRAPC